MQTSLQPTEDIFYPAVLMRGRERRIDASLGINFVHYLVHIAPEDPLRTLLEGQLFALSMVPSRDSIRNAAGYEEQMQLLCKIFDEMRRALVEFEGVIFLTQGRICGLFNPAEGEVARIHQRLEQLCRARLQGAEVQLHGVCFGPWEAGTPIQRIFFVMDEIWRYFNFITEKPNVYCQLLNQCDPEGYDSWEQCWSSLQERMVRALAEGQTERLQQAANELVSAAIHWGVPNLLKIFARVLQSLGELTHELLRRNMLALQKPEEYETQFTAAPDSLETEADLRRQVALSMERLFAACRDYELVKSEQLIVDLKQHIERNLADYDLSTQRLAKHFHMSAEQLGARFRAACACSVADYVHLRRVERIKGLLVSTDMTVEQIMELVGYFSRSTMYRAFHRLTGMNPKDYRAAFQRENLSKN